MWKLNILKSRRRVFKSQYREMKNITLNKCELLFSSGITDTNFKHTLWWTLEKKSLTHFMSLVSFSTSWKHQKNSNIILTLSRRRPLSYRNQSIDYLRKSVDWFLYDNDLRLERVKYNSRLYVFVFPGLRIFSSTKSINLKHQNSFTCFFYEQHFYKKRHAEIG